VGQIPLGETALHSLGRIYLNPLTLDLLHRTATSTPTEGSPSRRDWDAVEYDIVALPSVRGRLPTMQG